MAFKAGSIVGEASLDTSKWKKGLSSLHGGIGGLAKTALKLGAAAFAAFGTVMGLSVVKATAFKKEMNNVNTLLDETKISTQELTKQILQLNPTLGSATEFTKGLYQAFSAGAPTAKAAMEMTTQAAKLAKAGVFDMFSSVDILSTAINAYGSEVMTAEHASDLFFQTIKYGKITGEQLAGTIGDSITLFATAGISMEELSAAVAALTKVGVPAAQTTTQLNAIVRSFLNPSEALAERIRALGFESGGAFLKAKGLGGALELVADASAGSASEMAKLLPESRALRGVMALNIQGGREYEMILGEMAKASGVTEIAFQKQRTAGEELKAQTESLQIVIGNIGKHFIDKVARGATEAARGMLMFLMSSKGMELIANIAGYVAGGFQLIITAVEPIWKQIGPSLNSIWTTLLENLDKIFGESERGAGGFKLLSIAVNLVVTSMIVATKIITATITLLADLVIGIIESGKTVSTFFKFLARKATWEEVKESADTAGKAFINLGKNVGNNAKDLYDTVRSEVKNFSGETETLAVKMETRFQTAFSSMSEYIKINWDEIITGQKTFADAFAAGMDAANVVYKDTGEDLVDETKEFTFNMKEDWKDYFDTVMGGFEYIISGIADVTQQFYDGEITKIKNESKAELDVLEDKYKQGLLSQEQYEAEKEDIETKTNKKVNDMEKKAFNAKKKSDIAAVWINAASSIAGWWAVAPKLGPIAGPIFAAVMTVATLAMAGVQTAAISKQEFVPAYAIGGRASGLSQINERGGEMVMLPDNSIVIPNDISRNIAASVGGHNEINVSFDGARISDTMNLDYIVDQVSRRLAAQLRFAS